MVPVYVLCRTLAHMVPGLRSRFNANFSAAHHAQLVERVCQRTRTQVSVPICETPVFLPADLTQTMIDTGIELVQQLLGNPEYLRASEAAIPPAFRVAAPEGHPQFLQVDFGLVRNAAGHLEPKLVELQAFPSVYGYQQVLGEEYMRAHNLEDALSVYLGPLNDDSYWDLLRRAIVANADPQHTVLLEVDPWNQKTAMDFRVHQDRLGIGVADIEKVRKQGRRLFYENNGQWLPIDRIYNRAIVDEIVRKGIHLPFDFRDDLDVEWAGHPNGYFRISKFSLPWLRHSAVPHAVVLSDWFSDPEAAGLPENREERVLKPLYSFAGKGIIFAPTDDDLAAIPAAESHGWLLQERVTFESSITTPHGLTQSEVRIMYVWPQGEELQPAMSLVRLGRGKMMGVDHNRDIPWTGGSAGLLAPPAFTR